MTLYVIGDVQGCFDSLQLLLERVDYQPQQDQLWFVGDLVNRGPKSLETLRFVKSLENCVCVLGNHDLHLLAVAYGHADCADLDTLDPILAASDKDQLLTWLRQRPLLHHDESRQLTMVHAGFAPEWDLDLATVCATEVQELLCSNRYLDYFAHMYGDKPKVWDNELHGWERMRFITNCFTRLRYVNDRGELALKQKGPLASKPDNMQAWFQLAQRRSKQHKIVFGHWSTLGLHESDNILAIDSGCLWGGSLTAAKFDQNGHFAGVTQVQCDIVQEPGNQ